MKGKLCLEQIENVVKITLTFPTSKEATAVYRRFSTADCVSAVNFENLTDEGGTAFDSIVNAK